MHDASAGAPTKRQGPRNAPPSQPIRNEALRMATVYFIRRHRPEYLAIRKQIRTEHPHITAGQWGAMSLKELRHRHRLNWARVLDMALQLAQREAGYVDGRRSNGRKAAPRPEYVVACDHCGASVGATCRRRNGDATSPHRPRQRAFAATQPSPAPPD